MIDFSKFKSLISLVNYIGCYHNIDVKYLQRYVDEACYRWNTRKDSENSRFEHMFKQSIGIVDYKDVKMEVAA